MRYDHEVSADRAGPDLGYFSTPGIMTDAGRHTALLTDLPGDVPTLCRVAQGLVVHEFLAAFYGVELTDEDKASVHLRRIERVLDAALRRADRPLSEVRSPHQRVAGNCRTFTVLFVSMLRAHGTPARARCGFGSYFVEGRNEDHWVAEYWNAEQERWVLVDAQIDEPQREAFPIDFDVTDVPRDRFIIAGDAWAACRAGDADPDTFGLTMVDEAGVWWIASNLVRDAAALHNIEVLPWDGWGSMPEPEDEIDDDLGDLFDRLATLTHDPVDALPELHELLESDDRIRVPPAVHNYQHGRDEEL